MAIQTNTRIMVDLEAHLVSKLEDYATSFGNPQVTQLPQVVVQALSEFFAIREAQKKAAEQPKP